jgi:hypothetical protein
MASYMYFMKVEVESYVDCEISSEKSFFVNKWTTLIDLWFLSDDGSSLRIRVCDALVSVQHFSLPLWWVFSSDTCWSCQVMQLSVSAHTLLLPKDDADDLIDCRYRTPSGHAVRVSPTFISYSHSP